jgi:tetraacyldisaccharide 4'-kinase
MEFKGLNFLLLPLAFAVSQLYGLGVRIRLWLYRHRLLTVRNLPCNVISIGNLVVGGTGKTPHVALLASYIRDQGFETAVLSRGYRGRKMKQGAVLSDRRNLLASWEDGGEEPCWLAKKLPGIPVLIGKNRYRSGLLAHQRWATAWAILDDGFQHLALERTINILLLNASRPFGNGWLLPLGSLREPAGEIHRADVVVITHSEQISSQEKMELLSKIKGWVAPKPVFLSEHSPIGLKEYQAEVPLPLSWLKGKKVLAFCGLARPDSLAFTLEQQEVDFLDLVVFPDHHLYREKDLGTLTSRARALGVDCLVTTEKDALKFKNWQPVEPKILILEIECRIRDLNFWRLIDRRLGLSS